MGGERGIGKGVRKRGFAAMNEVELTLVGGVVPDAAVVGDWYLRRGGRVNVCVCVGK